MVAFLVHYDITIIREIVFNEKTIILLKHVMNYLFLFFFLSLIAIIFVSFVLIHTFSLLTVFFLFLFFLTI